jgi:hypothetical protein
LIPNLGRAYDSPNMQPANTKRCVVFHLLGCSVSISLILPSGQEE